MANLTNKELAGLSDQLDFEKGALLQVPGRRPGVYRGRSEELLPAVRQPA